MREILFRGKRMDNKEWVCGSTIISFNKEQGNDCNLVFMPQYNKKCLCIHDTNDNIIAWDNTMFYKIDPSTIGQFTGLCDKNGNRIFDGDICRFKEWQDGEFCWVGTVKFDNCQFLIAGGPNKECETPFTLCLSRFSPEQIEVIGNIYDN